LAYLAQTVATEPLHNNTITLQTLADIVLKLLHSCYTDMDGRRSTRERASNEWGHLLDAL